MNEKLFRPKVNGIKLLSTLLVFTGPVSASDLDLEVYYRYSMFGEEVSFSDGHTIGLGYGINDYMTVRGGISALNDSSAMAQFGVGFTYPITSQVDYLAEFGSGVGTSYYASMGLGYNIKPNIAVTSTLELNDFSDEMNMSSGFQLGVSYKFGNSSNGTTVLAAPEPRPVPPLTSAPEAPRPGIAEQDIDSSHAVAGTKVFEEHSADLEALDASNKSDKTHILTESPRPDIAEQHVDSSHAVAGTKVFEEHSADLEALDASNESAQTHTPTEPKNLICSESSYQLISHKVKQGESLWILGKKYNIGYLSIVEFNTELSNRDINLIYPGEVFFVPKLALTKDASGRNCYMVKSGDSLWSIGVDHEIDYTEIINSNESLDGRNIERIFPGEVYFIP